LLLFAAWSIWICNIFKSLFLCDCFGSDSNVHIDQAEASNDVENFKLQHAKSARLSKSEQQANDEKMLMKLWNHNVSPIHNNANGSATTPVNNNDNAVVVLVANSSGDNSSNTMAHGGSMRNRKNTINQQQQHDDVEMENVQLVV